MPPDKLINLYKIFFAWSCCHPPNLALEDEQGMLGTLAASLINGIDLIWSRVQKTPASCVTAGDSGEPGHHLD